MSTPVFETGMPLLNLHIVWQLNYSGRIWSRIWIKDVMSETANALPTELFLTNMNPNQGCLGRSCQCFVIWAILKELELGFEPGISRPKLPMFCQLSYSGRIEPEFEPGISWLKMRMLCRLNYAGRIRAEIRIRSILAEAANVLTTELFLTNMVLNQGCLGRSCQCPAHWAIPDESEPVFERGMS